MPQRDTLRYLFPAVAAVLFLAGLIAAEIFETGMLGTRGESAPLIAARVPSGKLPPTPAVAPSVVAQLPGVAPSVAPTTSSQPSTAPSRAPSSSTGGVALAVTPGAGQLPTLTGTLPLDKREHFPWTPIILISTVLGLLFVLLWFVM